MTLRNLLVIALNACAFYMLFKIVKMFLYPKILDAVTTEVEHNPSWLSEKLRSEYYGFSDIDFVTCECPLCNVPRFRVGKDDRLILLVPNDFTSWDRERVGKIALIGKIRIKYGLTVPDKPIYWLSILCYLLDGGDINVSETRWEENKESEKRQENS